jgi:chorismate binding enzyme
LEKERRGVYAGAVGRFDFADDEMDTCIAIRTMTFKDGTVYLQAGGGIVYDSVEEDEYVETLNKLGGNLRALEEAESRCPCSILDIALTRSKQDIGTNFKVRRPEIRISKFHINMYLLNVQYPKHHRCLLGSLALTRLFLSSSDSRRATPSLPAMLNTPATNSAVRVLSSFAGIGYITMRGSTFESMMPIVGMCSMAHSRIAFMFASGLRNMTRSGTTFSSVTVFEPNICSLFVKVPGSHFSAT